MMIHVKNSRWFCVKVLIILFITHFSLLTSSAQQRFSPEKYQADLEQFITQEANLTSQEAAAFFPLLREMQEKQRAIYNQMQAEARVKPADEKACKRAIQKRDEMELELKRIQQTYHNKFLAVLSASKVFDVIRAEERFNRRMFRNWGMGRGPQGPQGHRQHQGASGKK